MIQGINPDLHCLIPTDEKVASKRWIDTVPAGKKRVTVAASLEELKSTDRRSWATIMQGIRRVQNGEIHPSDFERGMLIALAGLQVDPGKIAGPMPWLAEIKVDKASNPKKWFRIYFGDIADEIGEPANRMLATGLHTKVDEGKQKATKKQTESMETAMKAIIWWCGQRPDALKYREQ